ncbi:MAG: hypothetical protein ACE5GA_03860 [Candidatus Zixiibacteriota bacterium]
MNYFERRIRYSVSRKPNRVDQPLRWLLALTLFALCLGVTFSEVGGDGYQEESFIKPAQYVKANTIQSDFLRPDAKLEAAELPAHISGR